MLIFRDMPLWFIFLVLPLILASGSLPIALLTAQVWHVPVWATWLGCACLMFVISEGVLRLLA